jgi:hypothetical protein
VSQPRYQYKLTLEIGFTQKFLSYCKWEFKLY